MCSGRRTSNSKSRSIRADAKPETRIAASMAATTMYRRLFPVFSAAMPITSTMTT
jgi:hypothetical protein